MNVLNFVQLPEHLLAEFQEDFPEITLYNATGVSDIEKYIEEAEIIFGNCPVKLLGKAQKLKWLQIVSAGIDAYLEMAVSNVIVTTAKGVHWAPIAEHLLLMMLQFTKNHRLFQQKQAAKEWYRRPDELSLLSGQTLGIIGFGGIARTLVGLVKPFHMKVLAIHKTTLAEVPEGVTVTGLEGLETLLKNANHIVIALPLTRETQRFLNAKHIYQIKPGAFLYNVSRGELIDEKTLIKRLQNRELGGAALDVFEEEPLPPDSPFWHMENVVITPHLAGHYNGLRAETFNLFKENLSRYLNQKPLKNIANFQKGY